MMSIAAANIFRKSLALKPDGLEGVLNNLDPEEHSMKNLDGRLQRRTRYLDELVKALNAAPPEIDKQSILRLVDPLEETVSKIKTWLINAKGGLAELNKVVKHQNKLLARAIADFVEKNRAYLKNGRVNHGVSHHNDQRRKVHFVKAST